MLAKTRTNARMTKTEDECEDEYEGRIPRRTRDFEGEDDGKEV